MSPRASHMLGALCHRTTPLQQGSVAGFKRHCPSVFCSLSLLVFLFKRYILIGLGCHNWLAPYQKQSHRTLFCGCFSCPKMQSLIIGQLRFSPPNQAKAVSGESESSVQALAWDRGQGVYGKTLVWKLTSWAHCDFITQRAKPHVVQSLSELWSKGHSQLPTVISK